MSFSMDGHERIGAGSDSVVYWREGNESVLKIYRPGIPYKMIQAYHSRQAKSFGLLNTSAQLGGSNSNLVHPIERVSYLGQRVRGLSCSILELNPNQVDYITLPGYGMKRTIAHVKYIAGETLTQEYYFSRLINEINNVLKRAGIPIGTGHGLFSIDPINVKVLGFQDQILNLMITDLGANINVSMAGHF